MFTRGKYFRKEMIWQKAILHADATIEEAIRNLSEVSVRIILVTNKVGVLEGTVCDGDIRRGLLNGSTQDRLFEILI